jgi:hypothetical protein
LEPLEGDKKERIGHPFLLIAFQQALTLAQGKMARCVCTITERNRDEIRIPLGPLGSSALLASLK